MDKAAYIINRKYDKCWMIDFIGLNISRFILARSFDLSINPPPTPFHSLIGLCIISYVRLLRFPFPFFHPIDAVSDDAVKFCLGWKLVLSEIIQ